jgi:gamma-glutamyltranspeptidase/glutathione hydrolase
MIADPFASQVRPVLTGRSGAIAAAHPLAVAAGQELLVAGGSVVDAMIAAQAVLSVVAPEACGLGGDMLCLVREPGGRTVAFNGVGAAPRKLRRSATGSGSSVTVPGMVAAWSAVHARYGRLPLSRILEPAIRLGRLGIRITPALARARDAQRERIEAGGGGAWALLRARVGDVVTQDELAMILTRIGKEGAVAFYRGTCAEAIVAAVRQAGGTLDVEDLASHQTLATEPVAVTIGGLRLLVQPPSSQGILLAMAAKALFALKNVPADRLDHAAIELTEASFAFRHRVAEGDALLDVRLAANLDKASRRGGPRAYLHTAGVSAADRFGYCVSSLVSVFDDFGSGVFVREGGFVLNNRAAGFTTAPNDLAPGKVPVHTLAPALLETPLGPLALSTPGADGQVQTLLQVLSGLLLEKLDLASVISRPRWRSENGKLLVEASHPQRIELAALGHDVVSMADGDMRAGAVTTAGIFNRAPIACADWRRETWASVA